MKRPIIFFLLICSIPVMATKVTCDSPVEPIHAIQGDAKASTLLDQSVLVKGVVTGDFRGKDALGGFFIQQQESDDNHRTSEGLFIQSNDLLKPLNMGDLVLVKGVVSEQFEVTQLKSVSMIKTCSTGNQLPQEFLLSMPLNGFSLEQIEGMRVGFKKPPVITDLYQYITYGEMTVSSQILLSPTAKYRPGKNIKKHLAQNKSDVLVIDDGSNQKHPQPYPVGIDGMNPIQASNVLEVGQQVEVVGVMHYAYGKYKLQPTNKIKFSGKINKSKPANPGGTVKVASFNIENFFTSIDNGKEACGPLKNFGCRGADSLAEYNRQLAKLVQVINLTDASVVGLQELENNSHSIPTLVKALNQQAQTNKWSYIKTGALGEDVIKVGLIYQPSEVSTVGDFALLNAKANPNFKENRNRIVVAQTFKSNKNTLFNVATAHLKSKSCRDAIGINEDQKDGQGCYNATRTEVAHQLADWLNSDPTGEGAEISILTGDLNSYQKEDPIVVLQEKGFANLANRFLSTTNWTASYRGQVGSLDYILVNKAADKEATGITQWHINSVRPREFGYNLESLDDTNEKPVNFYQPGPFNSSDHDVVLAGFDL